MCGCSKRGLGVMMISHEIWVGTMEKPSIQDVMQSPVATHGQPQSVACSQKARKNERGLAASEARQKTERKGSIASQGMTSIGWMGFTYRLSNGRKGRRGWSFLRDSSIGDAKHLGEPWVLTLNLAGRIVAAM